MTIVSIFTLKKGKCSFSNSSNSSTSCLILFPVWCSIMKPISPDPQWSCCGIEEPSWVVKPLSPSFKPYSLAFILKRKHLKRSAAAYISSRLVAITFPGTEIHALCQQDGSILNTSFLRLVLLKNWKCGRGGNTEHLIPEYNRGAASRDWTAWRDKNQCQTHFRKGKYERSVLLKDWDHRGLAEGHVLELLHDHVHCNLDLWERFLLQPAVLIFLMPYFTCKRLRACVALQDCKKVFKKKDELFESRKNNVKRTHTYSNLH